MRPFQTAGSDAVVVSSTAENLHVSPNCAEFVTDLSSSSGVTSSTRGPHCNLDTFLAILHARMLCAIASYSTVRPVIDDETIACCTSSNSEKVFMAKFEFIINQII